MGVKTKLVVVAAPPGLTTVCPFLTYWYNHPSLRSLLYRILIPNWIIANFVSAGVFIPSKYKSTKVLIGMELYPDTSIVGLVVKPFAKVTEAL